MSRSYKIALMVPANNTTVAAEFPFWFPTGVTFETVRIPRPKGLLTLEVMPDYKCSAFELAEGLANKNFDLIAYACTAASFLMGPQADLDVAAELTRQSGVPAITTGRSMRNVLKAIDAHNIALVSPYSKEVNRRLVAYLDEFGIKVPHLGEMLAADTDALGRITAPEVGSVMRATMAADCDSAFIACAQLPSVTITGPLTRDFGKPVWSSVKATAWAAAQTLDIPLRADA